MNAALTRTFARTHQQDLAAANNHTLGLGSQLEPFWGPVVIRIASAGDRRSLERLAELDSTETPLGPMLIGEVRERPIAALSLGDGKAIADPFVATGEIIALLRLRARQLNPPSRAPLLQRLLRPMRGDRAAARSRGGKTRTPDGRATGHALAYGHR